MTEQSEIKVSQKILDRIHEKLIFGENIRYCNKNRTIRRGVISVICSSLLIWFAHDLYFEESSFGIDYGFIAFNLSLAVILLSHACLHFFRYSGSWYCVTDKRLLIHHETNPASYQAAAILNECNGNKLEAIKRLRETAGISLTEAKEIMDLF